MSKRGNLNRASGHASRGPRAVARNLAKIREAVGPEIKLGLDNQEFWKPYDAMPALYRDVDMLLYPTVREGFGLSVAEAMASGLPVVATDCSSIPELMEDGKGGFQANAVMSFRIVENAVQRAERGGDPVVRS